jgi:hypothetical protein
MVGSYGASGKALFSALEAYRYESGEWKPVRVNLKESLPIKALRVVTYNILFDYFEADKIYSPQRNRLLFDLLDSTDADVIGLEVRQPLSVVSDAISSVLTSFVVSCDRRLPRKYWLKFWRSLGFEQSIS